MLRKTTKAVLWYDVYNELSRLLQQHYKKYAYKSGARLFALLKQSEVYKKHNQSWINNAERRKIPQVDPIQFFMSFNRNKQTSSDRTEVINAAVRVLNPKAAAWQMIDFTGCPAPVAFQIQKIRPIHQQAQIWAAFSQLAQKGRDTLTNTLWQQALSWEGIQTAAFTIFLFWIRSDSFLPLDKNTKRLLVSMEYLLPHTKINFEEYRYLLSVNYPYDYRELSKQAFLAINFQEESKGSGKYGWTTSLRNNTFRLIGIRTLINNPEAHKILKPGTYYPLDQVIMPDAADTAPDTILEKFTYTPSFSESLYHLTNLKVNLTAIVGKNGSGKSSLVDLLLMGIYNLSIQSRLLLMRKKALPNLQFELYWHSDTLYTLRFADKITLHRYNSSGNDNGIVNYDLIPETLPAEQVDRYLFYSILVNYSHYALNGSEMKTDWVTPLSHKNDGYQIPVVINPQRTHGNININREKELLNMRLLHNLLELHDKDYPGDSFRYIDNGKYIGYFSLSLNRSKIQQKKQDLQQDLKSNVENTVNRMMQVIAYVYDINLTLSSQLPFMADLYLYIVHKLQNITTEYLPEYSDDYLEAVKALKLRGSKLESVLISGAGSRLRSLLEHIQSSPSHFTIKFMQAINFLRYPSLQQIITHAFQTGTPIKLDDYNDVIADILVTNIIAGTADMLPPAIFTLEFLLDDETKSPFRQVSSGEFQLVSVLSSILYHIRNIESNITETSGYRYISILLDEIELYFHPDMQRHFVKRLLQALSMLETNLEGLHILFSTHSPFILSDLQQSKILKLSKGNINRADNTYNTFAANIHDLLADEFFLKEGYMGAFAQKHIETAILQLNYRRVQRELNEPDTLILTNREKSLLKKKLNEELRYYQQQLKHLPPGENALSATDENLIKEKSFTDQLIETIGEPLIRENMRRMYLAAYPETTQDTIDVKAMIRDMMKKNNITTQDLE